MSSMTPVRIRGKRSATPMEKWNHGKQRKTIQSRTPSERSSSVLSSSSDAKSSRRRERKQPHPHLSRLEVLPTEILHAIFEFSANPDMPLASPRLASQLDSRHLYHELTSRILQPVIEDRAGSKAELKNAMRLMNSKFFTWQFFKEWLRAEFEARGLLQEWQDADPPTDATPVQAELWARWSWNRLRPHIRLSPPKKLLKGPFTEDKVRFLTFVTSTFRDDQDQLDPLYLELARDGLEQAITEGAEEALPSFWTLGLQTDTELLRLAVIHAGCKKEIVRRLLTRAKVHVNFLDPDLWSWADKARMSGDERGPWLMAQLKRASRGLGRTLAKIDGI